MTKVFAVASVLAVLAVLAAGSTANATANATAVQTKSGLAELFSTLVDLIFQGDHGDDHGDECCLPTPGPCCRLPPPSPSPCPPPPHPSPSPCPPPPPPHHPEPCDVACVHDFFEGCLYGLNCGYGCHRGGMVWKDDPLDLACFEFLQCLSEPPKECPCRVDLRHRAAAIEARCATDDSCTSAMGHAAAVIVEAMDIQLEGCA